MYYISLRKSREVLFNGSVFENNDSNYYHPKLQTNTEIWYVNENFWILVECYISLER